MPRKYGNILELLIETPPQLQVIIDILEGKDPEQRKIWCIDTEFSLFGDLVYELAVVDCQSNEIALNTLVKHSPEVRAQRDPRKLENEAFLTQHALKVREASTKRKKFSNRSDVKSLKVNEIVEI